MHHCLSIPAPQHTTTLTNCTSLASLLALIHKCRYFSRVLVKEITQRPRLLSKSMRHTECPLLTYRVRPYSLCFIIASNFDAQNAVGDSGNHPLHLAAAGGHLNVVKCLLVAGASLVRPWIGCIQDNIIFQLGHDPHQEDLKASFLPDLHISIYNIRPACGGITLN